MALHDASIERPESAHKEPLPSNNQRLNVRGRSRTPPHKRVITFDCDQKKVKVRKAKSFNSMYPKNLMSDTNSYTRDRGRRLSRIEASKATKRGHDFC